MTLTMPLPLPPPLPQPVRNRLGQLLAWVVIVSVVAMIFWTNWQYTAPIRKMQHEAEAPGIGFCVTVRYLVGTTRLLNLAGRPSAAGPVAADRPLQQALQRAAKTPSEQFWTVPVLAEIAGPEAAVGRLRELAPILTEPKWREKARDLEAIYAKDTDDAAVAKARQRLRLSDGAEAWFARLGASHGLGDDDPVRRQVMALAWRTLVMAIVVGIAALAALAGGVLVFIVMAVKWVQGTLRSEYVPPGPLAGDTSGLFVEGFALYVLSFPVVGPLARLLFPRAGLLATAVVMACLMPLPFIYLRLRGVGWGQIRQGIGWRRGRGIPGETGCALMGYMAGIPLLAIAAVITLFLNRLATVPPAHPIMDHLYGGVWNTVGIYLLACVYAPVVEETMFRGILYHYLRPRWGFVPAAALIALLFAVIHPQGWTTIPVLAGIAVILAALREWRGSLMASVIAHGVHNGLALTIVLLLVR